MNTVALKNRFFSLGLVLSIIGMSFFVAAEKQPENMAGLVAVAVAVSSIGGLMIYASTLKRN